MYFRRIFGPTRIDSGSAGEESVYQLPVTGGGHTFKQANYQIKIYNKGGDSNLRIELELVHGPDGDLFAAHSVPIGYSSVTDVPSILSGDSDSAKMVGEYRRALVKIKANTGSTAQWAVVEVFELLKPF